MTIVGADKSNSSNLLGEKFGVRAIAFVIDSVIIIILNNIVAAPTGILLAVIIAFADVVWGQRIVYVPIDSSLLTWLLITIQFISYYIIFEWLYSRTPGKRLLNMQVVSCEGNICTIKQVLMRTICRFVDGLFLGVIAFVNMKAPLYQRLGDKIAGTLVVNSNQGSSSVSPKFENISRVFLVYLLTNLLVQFVFSIGELRIY